jgi:transposase InsO family protein
VCAGVSGCALPRLIRAHRAIPTWWAATSRRRPKQLWVTDLTFVPIWAGVAYVCFIVDAYSRMIVGWRVASHMRTTVVLDAIEMAR